MKKFVLAAAVAALALTGCQKHVRDSVDGLLFTTDLTGGETRTGWTGETIEWTAGDAIDMAYTVDGEWVGPALYPSTPLAEGGPKAHFKVPGNFQNADGAVHLFYALYPAQEEADFSDAPLVFMEIPGEQTPTADSFDPSADLLAGHSRDTYTSLPTEAVPLKWIRLTAHGDITLKNLDIDGDETVNEIVLEGQDPAELTGPVLFDLTDPENYTTGGSPKVIVKADNLSVEDGNLHFWISIFPVTLTELTVTVDTDKAVYRKTFTGISKTFTRNARNILGISMNGAQRTSKEEPEELCYKMITTAPDDWEGDYLIVYVDGGRAFDGSLTSPDAARNTISVDIQNGMIACTETTDGSRVTLTRSGSGYAVKTASGLYIGQTSNGNGLASNATTEYVNTLSCNKDGSVNMVSSGAYLRFNKASDQQRFRYYKSSSYSGQQAIYLFKRTEDSGGDTPPPPEKPTVTTGDASSVTQSEATLAATYTGDATYGGFLWGMSANDLEEDWQASELGDGSFTVDLNGLGAGHTYYYQAYVAVLENGTYEFYYGEIKSFTTPAGEIIVGGDQPGWYEAPLMDITHSGEYMYNTSDPTQYYAIHMCTGGEKGPGGKTARNYTVCYSAEYHCPLWVAAPRHSMYVGNSGRNDNYRKDPDIPADIQYDSKDTGGGCNKGHMLGSAERTSSKPTNRDVFYYTNIAPQLSANFNTGGGRWNVLEDYVDTQVCADTLYEVIGCYFDRYTDAYGETQYPSTISFGGRDDVSMPTMFYYVLLRTKSGNSGKALADCSSNELKCVAFVRSHVNVRQDVSSRELMSVAELEQITGVTYFPNVPNAPKDSFKASDWGL